MLVLQRWMKTRTRLLLSMTEEKDFIVDNREYTIRGVWKGPDWTWPAEQTGPERRQERVREEEKREEEKWTEGRAEDQDNQEQIKRWEEPKWQRTKIVELYSSQNLGNGKWKQREKFRVGDRVRNFGRSRWYWVNLDPGFFWSWGTQSVEKVERHSTGSEQRLRVYTKMACSSFLHLRSWRESF